MKGTSILTLLLVLAFAAAPAFADLTIGLPANSNNCFPFGCAYSNFGSEYQQVYSSTQFSGPIDITDLEFFNTLIDYGATTMNSGTWTISLSTTSADWDTLSSTYANNIGSDNTQLFSGNLYQPWAFGDTLSIVLTTPFLYNPLNGNLLMDVQVSNTTAPGGWIFFDAGFNNYLGRVWGGDNSGSGAVGPGFGLVTEFSSTTPEPTAAVLFSLCVAGIGLAYRRRLRRS